MMDGMRDMNDDVKYAVKKDKSKKKWPDGYKIPDHQPFKADDCEI